MSTPPARGLAPKPPEKGVFPLDHFGECKDVSATTMSLLLCAPVFLCSTPVSLLSAASPQIKERYLKCLAEHNADAEACRQLTKEYLECRMERCAQRRGLSAQYCCCLPQPPMPATLCDPFPHWHPPFSNLMAKQDLKDLGFTEGDGPKARLQPAEQQLQQRAAAAAAAAAATAASASSDASDRPAAAREGFVAGTLRFRKPGT